MGTTWSSLTGVPLEFAELAPTSPATALNGICADFELAPLTQLADYLFEHLADAALKARLAAITLFERRSYVLLRMFTPCANHWRAYVCVLPSPHSL